MRKREERGRETKGCLDQESCSYFASATFDLGSVCLWVLVFCWCATTRADKTLSKFDSFRLVGVGNYTAAALNFYYRMRFVSAARFVLFGEGLWEAGAVQKNE